MAAAITRRARLGKLTEEQARKLVAAWTRAVARGLVTPVAAPGGFDGAVELALPLRHPLQDCFYLALARRLAVPLVTADRTFAKCARMVHPQTEGLRAETGG